VDAPTIGSTPSSTAPPGGAGGTTTTTTPGGPPPASLTPDQVEAYLRYNRTPGTMTTTDLLAALRPLVDSGFTAQEVAILGMGRFPVAGEAQYRDDWLEPRTTPTPHLHQGTDIFAAFDVPVRSPADGIVRLAEEGAGGRAVYVTEPDGTFYYLAHLSAFAPGLASGDRVRVGQVVGYNGDSGNARGGAPHVHFQYHPRGGAPVNPKPLLDQWLAEALAAVPALLAPYRSAPVRVPVAAYSMLRQFEHGLFSSPARPSVGPQQVIERVLDPLTPAPLSGALADRSDGGSTTRT
jgi:hypothetical protein